MKEELLANGWDYADGEYVKIKNIGLGLHAILTYRHNLVLYCDISLKHNRYRISESILEYDIDYDYFKKMCNQIYKDGIREVFDKDIV